MQILREIALDPVAAGKRLDEEERLFRAYLDDRRDVRPHLHGDGLTGLERRQQGTRDMVDALRDMKPRRRR